MKWTIWIGNELTDHHILSCLAHILPLKSCICGSGCHPYNSDSAGDDNDKFFLFELHFYFFFYVFIFFIYFFELHFYRRLANHVIILQGEYNITAFVEPFKILIYSNPISLKITLALIGFVFFKLFTYWCPSFVSFL